MRMNITLGPKFEKINNLPTFVLANNEETTATFSFSMKKTKLKDKFWKRTGIKYTLYREGQIVNETDNKQPNPYKLDLKQFGQGYFQLKITAFGRRKFRYKFWTRTKKKNYDKRIAFKIIDTNVVETTADDNFNGIPTGIFAPFKSTITDILPETNTIIVENKFDKNSLGLPTDFPIDSVVSENISTWAIRYNTIDYSNLNTLLSVNGQKSLIVNAETDSETFKLPPYSVVLKTYEPLVNNITSEDKVSVVKEMAEPIKDTIRLVPFNDADLGDRYLYQPNNKSIDYINNSKTSKQTQDSLLTDNNFLSGSLFNAILSGSNEADINVDYNDYGNFSTFGSVRKRLENFWNKLERIEYYSKESGSLSVKGASTASVYTSEIVKNEELKNGIINNFDHFEKYLYYESSSANSSSFGLEFDTSWPKENSTKPHNVLSVTSSAVMTWYNNNIQSASLYDASNPSRLMNLVPEYLKGHHITSTNFGTATESYNRHQSNTQDSDNKPFLDFLDMTGHYFDNVWVYIKAFEDIYDRREKLNEGLSKDLVWAVSNAFGWNQPSGKEILDLHRYFKGYQLSGSATSSTYEVYSVESEKDIEREIWGRVLTSMPYILKTKGTKESIQALVNAYGIPPTILRVNEYGGPDNKDYQPNFNIQQRYTTALDFKNSQYILNQWKESSGSLRTPDSIEFRFKAASSSNQVLLAKDGDFAVRLLDEGSITDKKGKVEFVISSSLTGSVFGTQSVTSSLFPVFNNEFWSVGVTRELSSGYDPEVTAEFDTTSSIKYNLYLKQYEAGRSKILYDSATSMTLSGSTTTVGVTSSYMNGQWTGSGNFYWGSTGSFGDMGVEFTGSLQEIRLWNAPLTQSAFDNHTTAPKSINGNHASASYTDLIFRLQLNESRSLATDSDLHNVAPDQVTYASTSSAFQSGSAQGFTANNYINIEQEEKSLVPNIGLNRKTNSKVRIEKNWIPTGSTLSVDNRTEESLYDTSQLDSNRLGVFFSPTDVINQDIIESLADLDIEKEIADPRDEQELFYRGLRELANSYFKKYTGTNNFWDYMRLVKYYDQAIFEQIKKVLPARTKFNFGVVIEPTILERSKNIVGKGASYEDVKKDGEINVGLLEATQSWRGPVMTVTSSNDSTASFCYIGEYSGSRLLESSYYNVRTASFDDSRYTNSKLRQTERYYSIGSAQSGSLGTGSALIEEPDVIFNEGVLTFISSSRLSQYAYEREFYYTSSAAVGTAGASVKLNARLAPLSSSTLHAYSSSIKIADYQPPADYSTTQISSYKGTKNTIKTTLDKELPIEINKSTATAVVSRKSGEGNKLEVVRKK